MFLLRFCLLVLTLSPSAVMAGELILEGYRLEEASVDISKYTGADGVPDLHAGNHLHDPCTAYFGELFTLPGGFVVVNDCQVVQCTKWTTEEGGYGGKTVIKKLVEDPDSVTSLNVLEAGSCRYVGKFFHKEDNCSVEGTPGSIPCTADPVEEEPVEEEPLEEPKMTASSIVFDTTEKVGISMGTIIGAALLALLILFCCCCRKKKHDKDAASDSGSTVDEEQALSSVPPRSSKREENVAALSAATSAAGGGWLKFGGKRSSKLNTKSSENVQASAKVEPGSTKSIKQNANSAIKKNQVSAKVQPASTKKNKQNAESAVKNSQASEKQHSARANNAGIPDASNKSWNCSMKGTTSGTKVPVAKKSWFGKKSAEVEEPFAQPSLPALLAEPAFDEKKGFHSLFLRKKTDQSGTEVIIEPEHLTKLEEGCNGNTTLERSSGIEQANSAPKQKKEKEQKKDCKAAETKKEATPTKKETVSNAENTQPVDCTCCGLRS